jgi:hypothetical protein
MEVVKPAGRVCDWLTEQIKNKLATRRTMTFLINEYVLEEWRYSVRIAVFSGRQIFFAAAQSCYIGNKLHAG